MRKAIIMVPDSGKADPDLHAKISDLAERDSEALIEPPPTTLETRGFVPIYDGGPKVLNLEHFTIWARGINKRQVPASALNRETKIRLRKLAEQNGRPVSSKMAGEIRSAILNELLPRALVMETQHLVIMNRHTGALYFEASAKLAETLASDLRVSLGSLPYIPWAIGPGALPRGLQEILSGWLVNKGTGLPKLALANTAEVAQGDDRVRWKGHDLSAPEVVGQVEQGYSALTVELLLGADAKCVLDVNGAISGLKMAATEQTPGQSKPPEARDADLLLAATAVAEIHQEMLQAT